MERSAIHRIVNFEMAYNGLVYLGMIAVSFMLLVRGKWGGSPNSVGYCSCTRVASQICVWIRKFNIATEYAVGIRFLQMSLIAG